MNQNQSYSYKNLTIISITKDDLEGVYATIESTRQLREQSNIEQIIIDGSSHLNAQSIGNFLQKEINTRHIKFPASGISRAFNYGISESSNEWLWFLNGGDKLFSSENGKLMLQIIEKSTADIVIFKIAYGEQLTERDFPPLWLQWPPISAWIPHPSLIIKKELFNKYGFFDENYNGVMDFDRWLKMTSSNVKVDMISIPLVLFDVNGFSSTQTQHIAKECLKSIRKNSLLIFKTLLKRNWLLFNDYYSLIKTAYLRK